MKATEQHETLKKLILEKHEPIAIVGIGLRFPGGNDDLDGFGEFLREGRSGIGPVPPDRWDVAAFTPKDGDETGKVHTTGGGFLDRIDLFDAQFFNISPKEAQYVDPQQRLLLETAWEALENANIDPTPLRHGNGGVYVGASSIDYALELDALPYEDLDGHLAAGITTFPISGRLSYFLGWRGPSMSVDTACASSLTALHLAVGGLRRRECDIALAGAVNALHHPRIFVMFSHGQMLAPDGRCKTFDESADGYSRAEGCGMLALKRLSDARRDGDTILALVRGTAIGQDGESAGLTVPNGTAQEAVIRAALANAKLAPRDIQYVEAHGTGTPLGDPIEMGAISDVFADSHTSTDPVVVGSVKTNLGHMEPAAGVAGVVKTVLQMRSRTIYPHLNFTDPSGQIPWDTYPVTVPTRCRPWEAGRRRAVVNSFGFAGAIAAAVVEEAPPEPAATEPEAGSGPHVLTLSAKSRRALRLQAERYRRHVAEHPEVDVGALCYTSNVGRAHFNSRLAGVASDRGELLALLDGELARSEREGWRSPDIRRVAMLFTGQGSQYPGMGAPLYRRFPVFRRHVDACDELLAPHLGRSVRALLLGEGRADDVHQTACTQPALFTLEYALAELWLSWGARPSVLLGHSIGEVVAAAVAGLLSLEDAAAMVAARGRLMQSVTAPGGMVAVRAPVDEVAPALAGHPDLSVAAVNAPQQTVVSGGRDSLAAVAATLRGRGLLVTELPVSHAFHSPLMTEMLDGFRAVVERIRFRQPRFTIVSNLTGDVAAPRELATPDYWVRHVAQPVRFADGVRTVDRRGRHAFLEVGPSPALTALARQCVETPDHLWLSSLHPADEQGASILRSAAQAFAAGLPLRWASLHEGRPARKTTLPTYAFDRKRYWLPVKGRRHGLGGGVGSGTSPHPLLGAEVSTPEQRAAGTREFRSSLSAAHPAYLSDHVVMGQVVFPGTGYLEVLLALQDAVYGHTRHPVEDVRLREALFLPEEGAVELRTRLLQGPGGTARVEIVSRPDGDRIERSHATATLRLTTSSRGLTATGRRLRDAGEAAEAAGAPDVLHGSDDVYAAYAAAGLDYGPAFQRMQWAHQYGHDLAVGELLGQEAAAAEQLPPVVLDAGLHTFGALGDDGNNYLPIRFGSFRMLKKPRAARLRSVLRLVPPDSPEVDLCADAVVLEGGQPVFELRGLGLKRVGDALGGRRHFFHEVRWVKRSLVGQATGEREVLVLNRGPAELAGLAGGAAGVGVRLHFAGRDQVTEILRQGRMTDVCWFWRSPGGASGVGALRDECERNYRDLLGLLRLLEQAGFGRGQRLWLVTQGAQWLPGDQPGDGERLAAATLWGFGSVLLTEYPSYRATLVDLGAGDAGCERLLQELRSGDTGEFQVAFRDRARHVRRLVPRDRRPGDDGNFALAIKELGQFSNIGPVTVDDVAPRGDEIQVRVHAAGLNFKDVLNALGLLKDFGTQPLGFECAGTVLAAGPDAEFRPGEEVIVNYLGLMRRRVTVPSAVAVRKPANLSFQEAAGLASVYVTAYYALHHVARLRAGDKVLVHAAAGGVGQAAVHLAKLAGAEVFATASPPKWPLLREQGIKHVMSSRTLDFADEVARITGGAGVDVVLNSLSKDFIPAGIRSLAANGRFVELGKVGAWSAEQASQARPDVSYHNFDLSELPPDELLRVNREIMRTVVGLVDEGTLPPIVTTAYSLDEVEEAFGVLSRGANVGKLVLRFTEDEATAAREVTVRPDRTYLVTGGLGALGLVTAHKLADLGARHLVLVSRRGVAGAEVAELEARLRQRADVTVIAADVANPEDVARVFGLLGKAPHPVAGIVHAAGALADLPVSAQTWESVDAVFQSKVYGTWLLHEASRSLTDLELFIGYSSAASVVGAAAQSNYAAGNAYLDNLMLWRASQGLPAMSVNWGPWAEVGMSARLNEQLLKSWEDQGVRLIRPSRGARALASLLRRGGTQVVAGEADWARFVAARPLANALYTELVRDGGQAGPALDLDTLLAQPRSERTAAIDEFVRGKLAAVLHIGDVDSVEPDAEFASLGLDSLMAVELKNALEAAFQVPLPASVAFDHPSTGQLAEFLDQQLTPAPAA